MLFRPQTGSDDVPLPIGISVPRWAFEGPTRGVVTQCVNYLASGKPAI